VSLLTIVLNWCLICAGAAGLPEEQSCVREAKKRYGVTPGVVDPKDSKPVVPKCPPLRPAFPSDWPKECRGTVAVHEVLISPSGKADRFWTIRTPCLSMDETVRKAILDRQCEPLIREGTAVPYCITMSTQVELR
jgi:hypothetical protein